MPEGNCTPRAFAALRAQGATGVIASRAGSSCHDNNSLLPPEGRILGAARFISYFPSGYGVISAPVQPRRLRGSNPGMPFPHLPTVGADPQDDVHRAVLRAENCRVGREVPRRREVDQKQLLLRKEVGAAEGLRGRAAGLVRQVQHAVVRCGCTR